MKVYLYKNASDNNVVNKNITQIAEYDINIYGDNVKENPTIILKYNASILGCNYIYIPDFGRYYYASMRGLDVGGNISFECTCDLLKSYASDICNSNATCTRSSFGNDYIKDNMIADLYQVNREVRRVGNAFNSSGCYLVTIGG